MRRCARAGGGVVVNKAFYSSIVVIVLHMHGNFGLDTLPFCVRAWFFVLLFHLWRAVYVRMCILRTIDNRLFLVQPERNTMVTMSLYTV